MKTKTDINYQFNGYFFSMPVEIDEKGNVYIKDVYSDKEYVISTTNPNQIDTNDYTISKNNSSLESITVQFTRRPDLKTSSFYLTRFNEGVFVRTYVIFLEKPNRNIDDYGNLIWEGTEDTLWNGIFIPEYLVAKLLPIDSNKWYKDPLRDKAMCMEVFADLESVLERQGLFVEFEEKTYDGKTKFYACVKQK